MMNEFLNALAPSEMARLLIDVALKGLVIVALAISLYLILRKRSAALRHLVLTLSCIGLVSLPWLSAMLPALQIPLAPFRSEASSKINQAFSGSATNRAAIAQLDSVQQDLFRKDAVRHEDTYVSDPGAHRKQANEDVSSTVTKPPAVRHPLPLNSNQGQPNPTGKVAFAWARFLPHVWLLGAALSLLMPLVGLLGISRLCRKSKLTTDKAWLELLQSVKTELGITRRVYLFRNPNIETALTWGVFKPKLLLPEVADEWSESQRRTVLLHELAHVQRFDWAIQVTMHLACAIHWFNPLVWWMSQRMYLDREQASDDVVLAAGVSPVDYASQLFEFATRLRPLQSSAAIPMAQQSTLRRRVSAVLDTQRPRGAIGRYAHVAATIACCCLIVPVAMLRAGPDAPKENETTSESKKSHVVADDAVEASESDAPKVKLVHVSPDEAAEYLRGKKGVTVGEDVERDRITWKSLDKPIYPHVTLKHDWVADPKDWQYIANLARVTNGFREPHNVKIVVEGHIKADTLAKCFEAFRKSKNNSFELVISNTPLNRKALRVLGSYPGLTGLVAESSTDDVTDEVWAECISGWPNAFTLFLAPTAGEKTAAAASKLEHINTLILRNTNLTEAELEPLQKSRNVEALLVGDRKTQVEYLLPGGFGKWQSEDADR